jgi:hypothetical protein
VDIRFHDHLPPVHRAVATSPLARASCADLFGLRYPSWGHDLHMGAEPPRRLCRVDDVLANPHVVETRFIKPLRSVPRLMRSGSRGSYYPTPIRIRTRDCAFSCQYEHRHSVCYPEVSPSVVDVPSRRAQPLCNAIFEIANSEGSNVQIEAEDHQLLSHGPS